MCQYWVYAKYTRKKVGNKIIHLMIPKLMILPHYHMSAVSYKILASKNETICQYVLLQATCKNPFQTSVEDLL